MKTTTLATLAALMGTCAFASAEDTARRPNANGPDRQIPPRILKKFDKDKDGKLSEDERKAAREALGGGGRGGEEARRAEILARFDKDKDGKLSEDERKAAREAMETRRKAMLEKFDANKNGKLDPDEIKAAREAGGLEGPRRPNGGGAPTAE